MGEARLLRRRGRVRDSAGLSAAARRANLAGSFEVDPAVAPLRGALLVLVDDVVTSGATLTEAAAELSAARRPDDAPVLAAVVAATPRRPSARLRGATCGLSGSGTRTSAEPSGRLSGRWVRD